MKKLHILRYLTLCTALIFIMEIKAQENQRNCSNSLFDANKAYEAGNFALGVEELNDCIDKLNRDEKFEGYRLLGLCHMYLGNTKLANESIISMLKLKPNYRDFPYFDPMEYSKMLANYDVWATFRLGIKAGVNFNTIRPINNYSMTGSEAVFMGKTGFQFGAMSEYFFRKQTSLNLEIVVEGLSYSRTADNVSGWEQEFTEKMTFLTIPLSVKHYIHQSKKYEFGLELGMQSQFLLRTNSNIILKNPETGESVQNTLDQKSQRNKSLFSFYPGIQLNRRIGEGWLSVNMRYGIGLSNVVNPDKRYDNIDFSISNQYVDSDMAFNPLYISIGYQTPLRSKYTVKLKN